MFLGAPGAIAVTKRSFLGANGLLLNERQMSLLAHESWTQRHGPEGHEGTTAFRKKRRPSWYRPPVARGLAGSSSTPLHDDLDARRMQRLRPGVDRIFTQ